MERVKKSETKNTLNCWESESYPTELFLSLWIVSTRGPVGLVIFTFSLQYIKKQHHRPLQQERERERDWAVFLKFQSASFSSTTKHRMLFKLFEWANRHAQPRFSNDLGDLTTTTMMMIIFIYIVPFFFIKFIGKKYCIIHRV